MLHHVARAASPLSAHGLATMTTAAAAADATAAVAAKSTLLCTSVYCGHFELASRVSGYCATTDPLPPGCCARRLLLVPPPRRLPTPAPNDGRAGRKFIERLGCCTPRGEINEDLRVRVKHAAASTVAAAAAAAAASTGDHMLPSRTRIDTSH